MDSREKSKNEAKKTPEHFGNIQECIWGYILQQICYKNR